MRVLNIDSTSSDWRARSISNFSLHHFFLDGVLLASVEGGIQGSKFPPTHPTRQKAFRSSGIEAKRFGRRALREFVWWQDERIIFGSDEHHRLIERMIRAKFMQNEDAMEALLATGGLVLTYDLGHPESSHTALPSAVFCDILTRLRSDFL